MKIRTVCGLVIAMLVVPGIAVAQKQQELNRGGADWPKEPRALKLLEREIESGSVGPLAPIFLLATPRYLVTYMSSIVSSSLRSSTVVTVTNQSQSTCTVTVSYFFALSDNSSPACSMNFSIPRDFSVDFCTRNLPIGITVCNSTCSPELLFIEGRAIVSSTCSEIGVSSRVYYTTGDADNAVSAITDSKIVRFGQGNNGD